MSEGKESSQVIPRQGEGKEEVGVEEVVTFGYGAKVLGKSIVASN